MCQRDFRCGNTVGGGPRVSHRLNENDPLAAASGVHHRTRKHQVRPRSSAFDLPYASPDQPLFSSVASKMNDSDEDDVRSSFASHEDIDPADLAAIDMGA